MRVEHETSVDALELGIRSQNALVDAGIRTLGDLVGKSEAQLLRLRRFGRREVAEIRTRLQERNLYLAGESAPPGPAGDDLDEAVVWLTRSLSGSLGRERQRLSRKLLAAIEELRERRGPKRLAWTDGALEVLARRVTALEAKLPDRDLVEHGAREPA